MSRTDDVAAVLTSYPQNITLDDDTVLTLRPATPDDKEAILAFAKGLDENDLLFLRVDITKATAVNNWLKNVKSGNTVSLLAMDGDQVVGYATVDTNPAYWTRRVGEIRINIAAALRSKGLGRHLTSKIFDVARDLGLKKIIAHMTPDQAGAQAAFQRLGFQPEALLADYIEDRAGNVHDLAIMSYEIEGLTSQVDEPLRL